MNTLWDDRRPAAAHARRGGRSFGMKIAGTLSGYLPKSGACYAIGVL
jgi:hypothetical protein